MFGFDKPEDGSAERFDERIEQFHRRKIPTAVHHAWWVVHNCIAHPMIGLFPIDVAFRFHDWTSRKITPEYPLERNP